MKAGEREEEAQAALVEKGERGMAARVDAKQQRARELLERSGGKQKLWRRTLRLCGRASDHHKRATSAGARR